MHLVFTLMRDESYRRRLRSVLCGVFRALINSLVCCYFCTPTTTFTDLRRSSCPEPNDVRLACSE